MNLPRFDATKLLKKLTDRSLVFVGDSLNRKQWTSMLCLLDQAIRKPRKHAIDHFYWAPLLLESNSNDLVRHRLPDRIVRAQSIAKHARHWTNADVLVFTTYLWWRRPAIEVFCKSKYCMFGTISDLPALDISYMYMCGSGGQNCYEE